MEKKLKSIGINSAQELQEIIGESGKSDLSYKIWNGKARLSKRVAILIKKKTGASLDFLLS